jgi:glutamate-1-semialdehyde 2,1-aminomutase
MSERYRRSEELLARAERTIPLGTQTFSKSKTQFPYGVSPFYATRAQGSRLWDADGNEYIDFISSLAAVTLGYNDPDVTAAVRAQLDNGVIFSPDRARLRVPGCSSSPCRAERARFVRTAPTPRRAPCASPRLHRARSRRRLRLSRLAGLVYRQHRTQQGRAEGTRSMTHRSTTTISIADRLFREHPGEFAAVIMDHERREPAPGFLAASPN